jgi:Otopetrin
MSQEHIDYVISMYSCFNNNTLGKLWTTSMPYLFPFIVEYRYAVLTFELTAFVASKTLA